MMSKSERDFNSMVELIKNNPLVLRFINHKVKNEFFALCYNNKDNINIIENVVNIIFKLDLKFTNKDVDSEYFKSFNIDNDFVEMVLNE